jgi:hypothetical protein
VIMTTKVAWGFPSLSSSETHVRARSSCPILTEIGMYRQMPTRGGPPAWGLGGGLTTPHRKKKKHVTKCYKGLWGCGLDLLGSG